MSKLYRARSLLYRRQILQVNTRWKAFDEIYKIYIRFQHSDLKMSAKSRPCFAVSKVLVIRYFNKFIHLSAIVAMCVLNVDEILSKPDPQATMEKNMASFTDV